jgi:hypothetical protein
MHAIKFSEEQFWMIGEKSPFHSLTRILANKRRKLVLTPGFNCYSPHQLPGSEMPIK